MNDILQDIEAAELHTGNTIKIINSLQNTITKLNEDEDATDIKLSQFEEETEYLKKLTLKVANDLPPPVPNSSSISLGKFNKSKSKSRANASIPKFIQAKPKIMMSEKSQQTFDRKSSFKNKNEYVYNKNKLETLVEVDPIECVPSIHEFDNESPLTPTKYIQHVLIPVNVSNLSTQSMPSNWRHDGKNFIYKDNYYNDVPFQKALLKQDTNHLSGVEHFAKLMQLCMDVKEERELDLEKQIFNLEEEMQTVIESNKHLYSALEKLEEQSTTKKLLRDSSTNTLVDVIKPKVSGPTFHAHTYRTSEDITKKLTEDIINCIHADIREITSTITKTNSPSRLVFREHEKIGKPKCELGKHVSFLENAIASMQDKLETAQDKQVELAIQSKAVVEAAHRMTNKPWSAAYD